MKEYIKLGFGFWIGYEIAKRLDAGLGEVIVMLKKNKTIKLD